MKYIAVIDTDDYKNFEFFEDGIGKYLVGKDAGVTSSDDWIPLYFKKAPSSRCNLTGIVEADFWERAGYDHALRDCGVL